MGISEGLKKFAELNGVTAEEVLAHIQRLGSYYGARTEFHNGGLCWPAVRVDRKVLCMNDYRKILRRRKR